MLRNMFYCLIRGGSGTAVTSKMERFVIIVNGFQPLTIITKRSILDVAAVLDPPLLIICNLLQINLAVSFIKLWNKQRKIIDMLLLCYLLG